MVHGYGAERLAATLEQGTVLLDPTAPGALGTRWRWSAGPTSSEAYISTGNGSYFRIHRFAGACRIFRAATFWINEARATAPNVEYKLDGW